MDSLLVYLFLFLVITAIICFAVNDEEVRKRISFYLLAVGTGLALLNFIFFSKEKNIELPKPEPPRTDTIVIYQTEKENRGIPREQPIRDLHPRAEKRDHEPSYPLRKMNYDFDEVELTDSTNIIQVIK